ncbi:hypothetical protein MATR_13650 [Marivirga tractuosa]|uniref:Lipoprotein n=1 Tax=Marivirga tractuosa (strain ATCC 23168 / DSM 4126 / NBRC 15989 / NCIMB 1408 / VKM B-1430 / H-43) TaxID=643867 RepID=E4TU77_MARTH|nr:hypothetical protein [Marivirga tractuosa]ADR21005.1 hypothetical protein Ftrac_1008 [Marivirga tractuosa DSM 4126]BDD14540.1 hypothetical protein MATR_13650 [Marivirga tractuosa]
MRIIFLSLILVSIGCSNEKVVRETTENNQSLVFSDTIEIRNQSIALSALNPKLYGDSLLFTIDGAYQDLFMYNLKTAQLSIWDNDYVRGTRLPNVSIHDYIFHKGYVYLFYKSIYKIYQFTIHGEFIQKITIEQPNEGSNAEGREFFEITEDGDFVINQEVDGYKSLQYLFQNTKTIGVYQNTGKAIKSFGDFPESYYSGGIVLSKFYNYLLDQKNVFTLNSVGAPRIRQYDLTGSLQNSYRFELNDFNEQIYYFENSPFDSKINDQITQIGKDVVKQDSLIYFSYQRYDNEIPPKGYETLEFKLGVLDLAKKSLNTFKIGGNNLVGTTKRMIPQIYDGKIYFLLSPNDTEKEQLILVEAEIQ